MRSYGRIMPQFWMGETGRAIRGLGDDAMIVALYLMTSPHANMTGLYYLPLPFLCYETGRTIEGASKALRSLRKVGFALYDDSRELVWVPEYAKYQVAETLKPKDKRITGIAKEASAFHKAPFYQAFLDRYSKPFGLPKMPPCEASADEIRRAFEAPSEPHRSQEQEQEQDLSRSYLAAPPAPPVSVEELAAPAPSVPAPQPPELFKPADLAALTGKPDKPPRKLSRWQAIHAELEANRRAAFPNTTSDEVPEPVRLNRDLGAIDAEVGEAGIRASHAAWLKSPGAATVGPPGAIKVWLKTWRRYLRPTAAAPPNPRAGVRAESVDWSNAKEGITHDF